MATKRKPDFPFKVCGLGKSGSKICPYSNLSAALYEYLTPIIASLPNMVAWGNLGFFAIILIMEVL